MFDHFYAADLTGTSAVEVSGGYLDITGCPSGEPEGAVRGH